VYQDRLNLYLAPQAFELRVLGKRRSRFIEADGVVDGLVALVRVFLGGVVNSGIIPVDLEVLRNKTRVQKPVYIRISVKNQPNAGEVFDLIFDGR
jgi:hypothetical protein